MSPEDRPKVKVFEDVAARLGYSRRTSSDSQKPSRFESRAAPIERTAYWVQLHPGISRYQWTVFSCVHSRFSSRRISTGFGFINVIFLNTSSGG